MSKLLSFKKEAFCQKDRFFMIPETLSSHIGYEEALVITRIKYWILHNGKELAGEDGYWIYNSMQEWLKQFSRFSLYKLKKTITSLERKGLLLSKKANAHKGNHTKWYSINFEKLDALSIKKGILDKNAHISTKTRASEYQDKKIYSNSKSTNRLVENQPIIKQRYNYTNKSSYLERKEEDFLETNFLIRKDQKQELNNRPLSKLIIRAHNYKCQQLN